MFSVENVSSLACANWQCSFVATLNFSSCNFEDISAILMGTDHPQLLSSAIATIVWFDHFW